MTHGVVLRPEAEVELLDAWAWYERQRPGLGDELVGCVEAAIARAARVPELEAPVHGEIRRTLVRRFPYAVFYLVDAENLLVLAVAHARREPGYWLDRR